ncbi:MAG: biopolymer transporter ExbD [Pedobacter sp.]|nr:biopolymer transporter ExbD [Chitinophagaceae bacterium]
MKIYSTLLLLTFMQIGYSQNGTNKVLPSSSSLVFLGNDSLGFYSASKPLLSNVTKGKLHDSTFVSIIIDSLKKYAINKNYSVSVKPTVSANVGADVKYFVDILNANSIENRKLDTLNSYEAILFNKCSFPNVFGDPTSMKLNLPKEESADVTNINRGKSITLILGKDNIIYAYQGKIASSVKKLDYQSVRAYIIENKKIFNSKEFTIVIKPLTSASYKNTIDILDEMTINNIDKYVFVDITEEDKKILQSLN